MTTPWAGHVVAGVDGSSHGLGAVEWAADWAFVHGLPLGLIAAYGPHTMPPNPVDAEELQRIWVQAADSDLATARARVEAAYPGLQVRSETMNRGAADALTEVSEDAALLVIGNRGLGAIKSVVLGSVAHDVATYAACPVVTVPHGVDRPGDRDIIVGTDGSEQSAAALEFALGFAARGPAKVVAIWAWDLDPRHPAVITGAPAMPDLGGVHDDLLHTLEHRLASFRERFPQVTVEGRVIHGRASSVLVDAAAGAGLLVVGSRGLGGFKRLLLGSTSQEVVRAAECAVAVVR